MSTGYNDYVKFGNLLVDHVLDKLSGNCSDFERVMWNSSPSSNILVGNLNGNFSQQDAEYSPNSPNSMSLRFLLEEFKDEISIDIKFYIYYRVYPTFEEQLEFTKNKNKKNISFGPIWKREEVKDTIVFDKNTEEYSLSQCISKFIDKIKNDENALRRTHSFSIKILDSKEQYNKLLSSEKNLEFSDEYSWNPKLTFENNKFYNNNEQLDSIKISLINETLFDENTKLWDASLFNPQLKINLGNNNFKNFHYTYPLYEGYEYDSNFRCLNCQGDYSLKYNRITTKNFGIYDEEKIIPINSISNVDVSFKKLSTQEGLAELDKIYSLMNEFYDSYSGNNIKKDKEFYDMKERFNDNLNLLKSNKIVFKAFFLMNKTLELNTKDKGYEGWRLFQIVFIVSQIKDIVLKEDRNTCELLHVMTGGGKSESYFGIVIFTAFYDRLSGKLFGVSGITKFPLRMLSIQQLQRISSLFIFAEKVRKDNNIRGHEFSIAYFVGSQDLDFPSHNRKILEKIKTAKSKNETISGKIINKCPLCGGEVNLDINEDKQVVIHKCEDCNEEFKLYFSDDEIYRTLPTFIVSTVDKWAGIALNRRFRNILGGSLDECPGNHGFVPSGDKCDFQIGYKKTCDQIGTPINLDFDTSPTLVIQDEMHLIKEGFGTIDSHFESLIEAFKYKFTGSQFKNIAMTATISGAKEQIQHLYHKDTRIFPPSLDDANGNTFFFKKELENNKPIIQRRIIGLKGNIQNTKLLFYILRYISEFIYIVEEDLEKFSKKEGFDLVELVEIITNYKRLLTYHNKKKAVHEINYSIDDYVNSKPNLYEIEIESLTGERNLDEIKAIINNILTFYDDGKNKDKLLAVNATNIVSHGVDIDEWNIMLFDGMPRSTSEYIQALSRVGRKWFGIVFVLFSYNKTRDLSFYQHFTDYHSILNNKVESVPLSRWAKLGFKQTFTSIFTATILNYLSEILHHPTYNTTIVIDLLQLENNKRILIDFIKKAYVADSDMLGSDYFNEMIENEVDRRIKYLESYGGSEDFLPHALKDSDNKYFKTQFGMRGIQDEIILSPHFNDYKFRSSKRGEI